MSLINDALKRANQNQPPPPAAPGAPLVAVAGASAARKNGTGWFLPALVTVLVGASAFFFWKWRQAGRDVPPHVPLERVAVAPAAQVPVAAPPPAGAGAENSSPVARAVAAGPVLVEAGHPVPPAAVRSTAAAPEAVPVLRPAEPVVIKLQAILFRLRNPTAILNGRTLEVGQTFSGAKLIDIQRTHVVIERDGRREMLELP